MKTYLLPLLVLLLLLLSGCDLMEGEATQSGSCSGTIDGVVFDQNISMLSSYNNDNVSYQGLQLQYSHEWGVQEVNGEAAFSWVPTTSDLGTYPLPLGVDETHEFFHWTGYILDDPEREPDSGTLTLTRATSRCIGGSFDYTYGTDSLSCTFDLCAAQYSSSGSSGGDWDWD